MASEETTTKGVSTVGLLGIVFIALKLIGKIDWSWGWVLAPFWIPFAIAIIVIVFMIIIKALTRS